MITKKSTHIIFVLLLFALCFSAFSICCYAEDFKLSADVNVIPSNPIGEPKFDIPSMIQRVVTEELVRERYEIYRTEKPKNYRYDQSFYLIEHGVSKEYWEEMSEMSYQGLTEKSDNFDCNYPTVYIPIFGDVPDEKGALQNRFIGYIRLHYNSFAKDYLFQLVLYSIADPDFKEKKNIWFYDDIVDYLSQNNVVAQQIFLIRHPLSMRESEGRVAVVQTNDGNVTILDVSNTLQLDDSKKTANIAYTIQEYRSLRLNVEKELYQAGDGAEHLGGGGNASLEPNDASNTVPRSPHVGQWAWIPFVLLGVATVGAVGVVLFKRVKLRRQ